MIKRIGVSLLALLMLLSGCAAKEATVPETVEIPPADAVPQEQPTMEEPVKEDTEVRSISLTVATLSLADDNG